MKLTQFSHGSGCGCKISPGVLREILGQSKITQKAFSTLLVGNTENDDAAVMRISSSQAVISTADFFTPVVDDAEAFGAIAAANALSDVYAMAGRPLMAIALLGWPLDKLSPAMASEVLDGAKKITQKASIPLAGGHSIDSPEPLFGLAVTGLVEPHKLKRNAGAQPGDRLYLTKALGIGIYTTAQKKDLLSPAELARVTELMQQLNQVGGKLGSYNYIHAMTDITGFGLLGHLLEMCLASDVGANIEIERVPVLERLDELIDAGAIPGGTKRNLESYGEKLSQLDEKSLLKLADPQTSGGLLIAVAADKIADFTTTLHKWQQPFFEIGWITEAGEKHISFS
jgi:selenide,water dikinase